MIDSNGLASQPEGSLPLGTLAETSVTRAVSGVFDTLKTCGGIAIIIGPSGVGKSCAAKLSACSRPNTYFLAADASDAKPVPLLRKIARARGMPMTLDLGLSELSECVRAGMDQSAILAIDNADALSGSVLLQLAHLVEPRQPWERGAGLVLIGAERLHAKIFKAGALDFIASRAGPVAHIKGTTPEDVRAVAASYGVLDPASLELVLALANRPKPPNRLPIVARTLHVARAHSVNGVIRTVDIRAAASTLGVHVVGG